MSILSLDQKQQKLLAKRSKYKFLSLLFRQKALIGNFCSLQDISDQNCSSKFSIPRNENVISHLPKNINERAQSQEHKQVGINFYCLKNVSVPGNSTFFLTADGSKIFYERIHQDERPIYVYDDEAIQFHSRTLVKIKNLPIKKYDDDAVYFGGTFTSNYYHFLIEILSKVEFLIVIPNYKKLKVVLDISIQQNENLKVLADFFLKDFDTIYIDHNHYHQFNKLWHITSINPTIPNVVEGVKFEAAFTKISPESISYLRKVCLQNYDENQVKLHPVSKVFLARKSNHRKYNESGILDSAKKYGFEPVYFEDLNIHEQIFIIKNAKYIVGASGAAWTNVLFATEDAKGLTWVGSVWGEFCAFTTIAELVNFELYTIRYESKSTKFHEDYILDVDVFADYLGQLLLE